MATPRQQVAVSGPNEESRRRPSRARARFTILAVAMLGIGVVVLLLAGLMGGFSTRGVSVIVGAVACLALILGSRPASNR
jgi:fatty acid desaturase